jgi:hypothetical protein
MSDEMTLSQMIEEIVDKGATSAEEIHQAIADMPLNVLEKLELFGAARSEVRRIQDTSIGAIYDLIRDVNHKVAGLAADMLVQERASED